MSRKVYLTKLRPEFREQYIEAHRKVSRELLRRYQEAGMRHCSVYLLEDTLVMVSDSRDHEGLASAMLEDEVDTAWQNYVRPMKADGDWQEMSCIFGEDL